MTIPYGPQVHPYLTMVQCSHHTLQVGLLPQEAVVVDVPAEYHTEDVHWLLTRCDGTRKMDDLMAVFGAGQHKVMRPEDVRQLLCELERLGVAHPGCGKERAPQPSICVWGTGMLAKQLRRMLALEDVQLVEARELCKVRATLVVLADAIVPDPVAVRELLDRTQPFLVCTLVDNRGVVGPLIVPSMLTEAGTYRLTQQLAQVPLSKGLPPEVAAQLMHEKGRGSRATVAATVAFAVSLIMQRTQLGEERTVLPYYQRMVVAPDAQQVMAAAV